MDQPAPVTVAAITHTPGEPTNSDPSFGPGDTSNAPPFQRWMTVTNNLPPWRKPKNDLKMTENQHWRTLLGFGKDQDDKTLGYKTSY
jgi:hypothetical protein